MFTGIIRAVGTIERMQSRGGDFRLSIRAAGLPWSDYQTGESISVNGVCLTAVELRDDGFDTDVSSETINVTALGSLAAGSRVNLEPAMSLGDRLGGHLVSGHVDCVGSVLERKPEARSVMLRIGLPAAYRRYVVKKGSVCVDGVSLTINGVSAESFTVNIIPHTAVATIAGNYETGSKVNIEVDLIARYLEGLLNAGGGVGTNDLSAGISEDFLRAHGYA
ncbi:MAG: riboflavin synthase [Woeseiaceae bacterium]